ncbi:hypothetical protein [Flammeovirga agarivorans]|uniref:Uncharacterized protein n=1 Tax=Flammeovirga agarivorans TaxID=2726742 RepID=A0A7X8SH67_9BACT|nr:hypothetical protein [Flammeovirga agarivorans]NLR90053.1 hypothetical protein [Flammeovirga agarivorans]
MNYKKYINLLTGLILLSSFAFHSSSKEWDGVILIKEQDNKYYAFVDNITNTDNLELVSFINNNRTAFDINKRSDVIELPYQPGDKGYIAVKQDNVILSSVTLRHIQYTNPVIFDRRVARAKEAEPKEEEVVVVDQQPITPPEPEEEPDVIEVVPVDERGVKIEETTTVVEEDEEGEAESNTFKMTVYEEFLVYNHYKHSMSNVEDIKSRDDLTSEIIKEAQLLEEEYTIKNDYYSWLHLNDIKKGHDWAFDGEYLFKIDPKYFQSHDTKKYALKNFRDEHDIKVKPHNKKWVGIYYKDVLLSEFKSDKGYTFKALDDNNFTIQIEKHEYKVNCTKDHITIRKDGSIINNFNTESLKAEPVPVFN